VVEEEEASEGGEVVGAEEEEEGGAGAEGEGEGEGAGAVTERDCAAELQLLLNT
jgi:hypothetical protein